MPIYYEGSDLPDLEITWKDDDGTVIDFSSGWTFEAKVGRQGTAASFTKSTGITGASTAPNVSIAWANAGELNGLAAGTYTLQIEATRTADSKERFMQTRLSVLPAVS